MNFNLINLIVLSGIVRMVSGCQVVRIFSASGKVAYNQTAFERDVPNAQLKMLFLGDSTALGTGAMSNTESVAGWFGQDFPKAHIRNISQNGEKLSGLIKNFPSLNTHYDLVILQIGGNDIMRFTKFKNIEKNLSLAIDQAKLIADHVVIMHSGNVGLAPIFSWPLNRLYTSRTRTLREIYIKKAEEKGVLYIDLFQERKDDIFLKDIDKYYAPDHLHPSGAGYHFWYQMIRRTLEENDIYLSE